MTICDNSIHARRSTVISWRIRRVCHGCVLGVWRLLWDRLRGRFLLYYYWSWRGRRGRHHAIRRTILNDRALHLLLRNSWDGRSTRLFDSIHNCVEDMWFTGNGASPKFGHCILPWIVQNLRGAFLLRDFCPVPLKYAFTDPRLS